jgi:release factor glutamine methyltransferase
MEILTNSVKYFYQHFKKELKKQYDEKEIIQFLYILFENYFGWGKTEVQLRMENILSGNDSIRMKQALLELSRNKPVQYITGTAYFAGLELIVKPGVLIPRPETEELVERIIQENSPGQEPLSILDIGTGSGCIAIRLDMKMPNSIVTAIDISPEGLAIAGENARRHGCTILFREGDVLDPLQLKDFPAYDIIVSNPPYVLEKEKKLMKPNVLEYEPAGALFVPDDDPMRFNRAIAEFSYHHLKRPGILYIEINERFGREVTELLSFIGFDEIKLFRDIHGKDRFVKASLPVPLL